GDATKTCTATAPMPTCLVSGLTNGTPYTFTVVATNAVGDSLPSLPSAPVIPSASLPGSPTNVTAVAGDAQATVSWHAPASDGGSPILSYTVTSSPGGFTCMWTLTGPLSCTVTGLTNGTTYTFTVTATTLNGTGAASLPSNPV